MSRSGFATAAAIIECPHLEAMRKAIGSSPGALVLRRLPGPPVELLAREMQRHSHDRVVHPWPSGDKKPQPRRSWSVRSFR
jgi:hypothetical protein